MRSREHRVTRLCGAVALTVLGAGGCMMQSQNAPALTGPSGFGRALTLTATPDTLPRDGSSQSVIQLNYRDADSTPLTQQRLTLTTTAGMLSTTEVVTDSAGNASFTLISPSLNTPATFASVSATPVSQDAANAVSQVVTVRLIGPSVPVAAFTANPAVPVIGAAVTYDASTTTLDGAACATACSYSWDFGDGTSASGQVVQHTFQALGVKVVTLTVTGPAGTSNSVAKSYSPATPTAPTAVFTVNPASPSAAASAVYDASASTVGAGARIVNYNWNFGDGTTAVDAGVPIYVRPAGYPVGVFAVTLTVTDDLGRTATKTTAVTVVP